MIFRVLINLDIYENVNAFMACLQHALAEEGWLTQTSKYELCI